jgi:Na+/proline symporter
VLLTLVIVYLLFTIAIGLYAARRVKNTADFAIAGRHLPLYMIVTTTFATWFGSETVLGIPAKFMEGGLNGVIEDPFGAGTCLILVGLFFAGKLYRMTLLTISDYYRERFGRRIEIACSLISGLYWRRASTQGAVASVALGICVWLLFLAMPWGEEFPAQLAGLLASFGAMVVGSLAPQWVSNSRTPHRPLAVEPA